MTNSSTVLAIGAISQLLLIAPSKAGNDGSVPPEPSSQPNAYGDIVGGLPLPFGVSMFYMRQDSNYDVTSLHATAGGYPVPGFGANAITSIHNDVDEVNMKLDWWAQPWLNFHAIFGEVDGETEAGLNPALSPLLGGMQNFKVDYHGIVYGGGMTVAGGYQHFFGLVTANYTWADVSLSGGSRLTLADGNGIETLVITPKIGWRFDDGSAVWVGAFYQKTNYTQSGSFNLGPPLGTVNFAASVKDAVPWDFIMGGEYKLSEHWILTSEVGLGNRQQILFGTSYRF